MAEYRTIRRAFWNDPFIEELPPEAKLLYLYLFTSPHTNNFGILEVSTRKIAFETGLEAGIVGKLLSELEKAGKVVIDGSAIWLANFIKNQCTTSDKIVRGLHILFAEISSEKIRQKAIERYPALFGKRRSRHDGSNTNVNGSDTNSNGNDSNPRVIDTVSEGIDTHKNPIHTPDIPILKKEKEREKEEELKPPLTPPQVGGDCGDDVQEVLSNLEKQAAASGSTRASGTNPRSIGTNPRTVTDAELDISQEPGIEFLELRQLFDLEMRSEGPLAGFSEYKQLKKSGEWPGLGQISHDIDRRKEAKIWNPGFEISLARYLRERTWLAPVKPRASPTQRSGEPATPTEHQKRQQDKRLMAKMVKQHKMQKKQGPEQDGPGRAIS